MPAPQDLYELLKVTPTATEAEIRAAYRMRVVVRHRRGALGVASMVQRMADAYKVLTTPWKRRDYDRKRELYILEPRRRENEQTAAAIRREGLARWRFARQIAAESDALGQTAVQRHAALLDGLAADHALAQPLPDRAAARRRLALRIMTLVVLVVAAYLMLWRWGGP